jgi:hypothetical protein
MYKINYSFLSTLVKRKKVNKKEIQKEVPDSHMLYKIANKQSKQHYHLRNIDSLMQVYYGQQFASHCPCRYDYKQSLELLFDASKYVGQLLFE